MKYRHDMLTHGVYVVCARHEGNCRGLTVAWGTQVSTDRILICVGKQSATREYILASGAFGLSLLAREQKELAFDFGTRSSVDADKFEDVSWHTAETGSPLLDDCAAAFDCRVEAVHDLDDEKLIVGRIVAAERKKAEYEPLLYREEDY